MKKLNEEILEKIKKIKNLITSDNILLNISDPRNIDMDTHCENCGYYVFRCKLEDYGGITLICNLCNKEAFSFNFIEYSDE